MINYKGLIYNIMGLFSALRDQFSSSPVPAFKREWLATLNYIQNLSYNEINDSKVVASVQGT